MAAQTFQQTLQQIKSTPAPQAAPQQGAGFHLTDLLPTIGSILGGLGAGALTDGVGAVAGAGAGGSAGEALQQLLTGKKLNFGSIAGQGVLGAAGQGVGEGIGGLIGGATKLLAPTAKAGIDAASEGGGNALSKLLDLYTNGGLGAPAEEAAQGVTRAGTPASTRAGLDAVLGNSGSAQPQTDIQKAIQALRAQAEAPAASDIVEPTPQAAQAAKTGLLQKITQNPADNPLIENNPGTVSKFLSNQGDNLAQKATGLTKSARGNFVTKYGQTYTDYLSGLGLPANASSEQIADAIAPHQQQFNNLAKQSGVKVPLADIQKNFQDVIDSHANAAPTSEQALAAPLHGELQSVLSKLPADAATNGVDVSVLDKLGQQYDDNTQFSNKTRNFPAADQNATAGNILRKTVQDSVDKAGLTNSITNNSLKDTGQLLSKGYTAKNLALTRELVGNGAQPVGLLKTLGLASAVSGHGPAGMLPLVASTVGNDPAVNAFLSKVIGGAGDRLAAPQSALTTLLNRGAGTIIGQTGAQGIAQAVTGNGGAAGAASAPADQSAAPDLSQLAGASGTTDATGATGTPAQQPGTLTQQQLAQLIIADIATTGGKNLSALTAIGNLLIPKDNPTADTASSNAQTALAGINKIEQSVKNVNYDGSKLTPAYAAHAASLKVQDTAGTNPDIANINSSMVDIIDALKGLTNSGRITNAEINGIGSISPYDTQTQALAKLNQYKDLLTKAVGQ